MFNELGKSEIDYKTFANLCRSTTADRTTMVIKAGSRGSKVSKGAVDQAKWKHGAVKEVPDEGADGEGGEAEAEAS